MHAFNQVYNSDKTFPIHNKFSSGVPAWAEVEAKANEGRSLAEAMPNEAEAQEEVLENEKRGQNIKGQNLNPAGNTCGLALLGQIR